MRSWDIVFIDVWSSESIFVTTSQSGLMSAIIMVWKDQIRLGMSWMALVSLVKDVEDNC